MSKAEAKFTPGEWKLAADGSPFVYALNRRGSNRMFFMVGAGWDDHELRTSDEELLATAAAARAAPTMYALLRRIDEAARMSGNALEFSLLVDSFIEEVREVLGGIDGAPGKEKDCG